MKEMLNFIYTGKAPNLEKMVDDLLSAADKVRPFILLMIHSQIKAKNTEARSEDFTLAVIL